MVLVYSTFIQLVISICSFISYESALSVKYVLFFKFVLLKTVLFFPFGTSKLVSLFSSS